MAREVHSFSITVDPYTAIENFETFALTMPPRIVDTVRIEVPPGCRGHVGFSLGLAGTAILPLEQGAWIVADDRVIEWQLEDQPDSGAWQINAYNTGLYPHTLTVTFLVSLPYGQPAPNVSGPATVPPSVAVANGNGGASTAPQGTAVTNVSDATLPAGDVASMLDVGSAGAVPAIATT